MMSYRNTVSKDGRLTIHLLPKTAERVREYCRSHDQSVMKFIEDVVNDQLDMLIRDELASLSKEMLVELILAGKDNYDRR